MLSSGRSKPSHGDRGVSDATGHGASSTGTTTAAGREDLINTKRGPEVSLDNQQSSIETSSAQDGRNRSSWLEQSSAVFTVLMGIVAIGTTDYTWQGKVLIGAAIASAIAAAILPAFIVSTSAKAVQRMLLVVTTMLVTVLISSTFFGWPLTIVQGHEGYGRFDSPDDGDEVSSLITLTGEADPAEDTSLWLLIQAPDNRWYTTQTNPVHVDSGGRWQVQDVGVGKGEASVGRPFGFFLVAVPKDDDPVLRALE